MHITFVEIANFRKLRSVRIELSNEKTVFVGANNSGKTSAMVAMRYFMLDAERKAFSLNDFTLSHWPKLDSIGKEWEEALAQGKPIPEIDLQLILPHLDLWLHVEKSETHLVQKLLPDLDWKGGQLGVRLRLEPKSISDLREEYLRARTETIKVQGGEPSKEGEEKRTDEKSPLINLWPVNLTDFLKRRMKTLLTVNAYLLDPSLCVSPEYGTAKPQLLSLDSVPLEGDPLKGLIKINEISAQRGFGQSEKAHADEEADSNSKSSTGRQLSDQLRNYYNKHLDPFDNPDAQDFLALKAIEQAQTAFDDRLKAGFSSALQEMETLGYPGVTDPKLIISTKLKPIDGLNHETAVQYALQLMDGANTIALSLPEHSNGLGYQNLISMVFRLMSYRDSWMRVGKASKKEVSAEDAVVPPLHLVLVEEPEAYLHTQVQQLFIRQAYKILRAHPELEKKKRFTTQLLVSTHSSHIAHECEFSSLRYFRRLPPKDAEIATSCVVNLANVFGDNDTERFVTRYLKVTHCDLFFADAAILIEGPAERILIPHLINNNDEFDHLSECYVTWLEIGGSHAHRLRSLIEHLGLTTLIITDLDAADASGNKVVPQRKKSHITRNATLKSWCPAQDSLDILLDLDSDKKVLAYDERSFAIRVAYQTAVTIQYKGASVEALANTLEDAVVFQNIDFFSTQKGVGLFARLKKSVVESASLTVLTDTLPVILAGGGKAELALDLLEMDESKTLIAPNYIAEGLRWLILQLKTRKEELGLAVLPATAPGIK